MPRWGLKRQLNIDETKASNSNTKQFVVVGFSHGHCSVLVFVYTAIFFLIFAHLLWFGVWGFWVLDWVFGVWVFCWRGLGPVVWGLLGFLGWGSLYKHKRITLGKTWCVYNISHYKCLWFTIICLRTHCK